MKTRAQEDSELAYLQISALPDDVDGNAYGGLCHHFPMLVLRSGLCQAVALYTVKANGKTNQKAYKALLKHMASASGYHGMTFEMFQENIQTMGLHEYQRTTRRILAAAIWYKRFAVSLLGVEHGGDE